MGYLVLLILAIPVGFIALMFYFLKRIIEESVFNGTYKAISKYMEDHKNSEN